MSNTTICANVVCANKGKMNDLVLETSSSTAGTSPVLTIKNTNADANGPVLRFHKDDITDGGANEDIVGVITFMGLDSVNNNTEYAAIEAEIESESTGAEEGKLIFNVACAAGARTEVMSITGNTTAATSSITIAGYVKGSRIETEAKTGDYTIAPATDLSGKLFTTTGASGTVTFTLPTPATTLTGVFYLFFNTVNHNMVIAVTGNDTLVTLNDVAANSVTFSTTNEKIGASAKCVCDGTKWLVMDLSENSITSTIAT